ncbi:MAG: Rrf2 family transcriptional regulator [Armatimonadetes bacterium]|nr:Rrf2 family transcriptional regulator [Armatimonadota bacterium]NIM23445.1 Rrf2 family transcriptional regulator [Armatimonadota bacterium]NIM67310.1 Rrf2 family transcriptional regulator [Armatimonadota bacterium]NIM75808.1 Rrf2 family transcriptional regulator [Armatimonadota bacterium]NIN05496.1 Rrf2 family transcriptional regulator [Armatimonadota bacterium]
MLKPSTRARYALRAMLELSLHEATRPLLLREIAKAQCISEKYLEQLTVPLRCARLLRGRRGSNGGYELAKPAKEIAAREIVEAVEGRLDLLDCVRMPVVCDRAPACAARGLWGRVSQAITAALSETTLADLREEQRLAEAKAVPSYEI